MVQTINTQKPRTSEYVVLRAICIQGERIEPGATLQLASTVGMELAAAGKVAPAGSNQANAAIDAAEPARPAKAAKAAKPEKAATEAAAPATIQDAP